MALKAAKAVGLDVVLMKVTPPVFAYDTSVDITQETIRMALEAGLQVKVSPEENGASTSEESGKSKE